MVAPVFPTKPKSILQVKTTNPKMYCVRPQHTGIVLPRSRCDVIVIKQAQKEAPPDMQMQCKVQRACG
ncbi:Vesicle-associated protein 1-1 [Stylosanthes scabra]|uniref:Vesicle-associated protein 1-1 n=1 Tax=Stylosanthes scabra TaxID=79078 RepID=A0ABU6UC29_9FABA|nr:Vesicle-associated protein 1-1 [Stylosanthes scabra]